MSNQTKHGTNLDATCQHLKAGGIKASDLIVHKSTEHLLDKWLKSEQGTVGCLAERGEQESSLGSQSGLV